MITFSDPLYLYSGSSMFTNLQQRLFGVGLQSLYRVLQLSKFNQLCCLLLSFLLRKLIRMRSSLDVLAKLLTSMKNGKVNGNALMPEISLHSIFLQEGENPRFSLLPATDEQWVIHWSEQLKCQTASHNPIVVVISTSVSIEVHFPACPTERQRLLLPSKIDGKKIISHSMILDITLLSIFRFVLLWVCYNRSSVPYPAILWVRRSRVKH